MTMSRSFLPLLLMLSLLISISIMEVNCAKPCKDEKNPDGLNKEECEQSCGWPTTGSCKHLSGDYSCVCSSI